MPFFCTVRYKGSLRIISLEGGKPTVLQRFTTYIFIYIMFLSSSTHRHVKSPPTATAICFPQVSMLDCLYAFESTITISLHPGGIKK